MQVQIVLNIVALTVLSNFSLVSAIKCYKCGVGFAGDVCPGKQEDKLPIVDKCEGKCSKFAAKDEDGVEKITHRDCVEKNVPEDGCQPENIAEKSGNVSGTRCYCSTNFCNGNKANGGSRPTVSSFGGHATLPFVIAICYSYRI